MSLNELQKIKNEFSRLGLHPVYLEHEPVLTSKQAAESRGFELKQGIKALLFTNGKGSYVLVNVPADKKVDNKKVATWQSWSKNEICLATPEQVLEITGCEIGSVPPFGHKTNIPILVDRGIYENKESAFNVGLRTHSVKIPTAEMKIVFKEVGAIEGDFAKE